MAAAPTLVVEIYPRAREAGHHQPKDGTDGRLRRSGDHRRRARSDRLLGLVLPRQLHEEGLVQEMAREWIACLLMLIAIFSLLVRRGSWQFTTHPRRTRSG